MDYIYIIQLFIDKTNTKSIGIKINIYNKKENNYIYLFICSS